MITANPHDSRRILVVDDDPCIRQVMFDLLSIEGYQVAVAEDGEIALQRIQEFEYDILITDLGLPGITGWELAQAARRLQPHLKTMAISSWQGSETSARMAENGIEAVVWKPFRFDQIREAIGLLLPATTSPAPNQR